MINIDFTSDIPQDVAERAYDNISHSPERRGASARARYVEGMQSAQAKANKAIDDGTSADTVSELFASLHSRAKGLYLSYLYKMSQTASTMIAGPANFPVERNRKRFDSAMKADQLFCDCVNNFSKKLDRINPRLKALSPIMAGDADAVERLERELARTKWTHGIQKRFQADLRKFGSDKENLIKALQEYMTEDHINDKINPRTGLFTYHSYELTYLNREIKRLEDRLAHVKALKEKPVTETAIDGGIRIEFAYDENRIRIHFPGKPEGDMIQKLKSNGFRWAPSKNAWSGYINPTTERFCKIHLNQAA